jgi:hypothetical protein
MVAIALRLAAQAAREWVAFARDLRDLRSVR